MRKTEIICCVILCLSVCVYSKPPHIVLILGDDVGWNDVGFHNPSMKTPNIDKLASEGVILDNAYVQPVCTPSRHSIMTGIYPFKAGLQHGVIQPNRAVCSPLKHEFFPQKLKKLGYATHMVGKWHLGMCNWNCTPTYRGFDSFYGYYNRQEDHYNKTMGFPLMNGYDFRDNETAVKNDTYGTYVYTERAQKIIAEHDKTQPLFLYLPFQNAHSPIEVPKKYEDLYPDIKTEGRRKYAGMVSALDDAIGNVTQSLKDHGLYDDTLIIFSADNGGLPQFFGSNYPLRGAKTTVFEGGTRAVSFLHGAGLNKTGHKYDGMIHAVDWHPTIVSIAGGKTDTEMDGIDQWESLRTGKDSKRDEFIYNLDLDLIPVTGAIAIRSGNYNLIQGFPGAFQDWYKPDQYFKRDGFEGDYANNIFDHSVKQQIFNSSMQLGIWGDGLYNLKDIQESIQSSTRPGPGYQWESNKLTVRHHKREPRDDPNEHNDISEQHPDIVKKLKAKIEEYKKSYVHPQQPPIDPKSNPDHYGGFWTPGWC